jgi:hypothetical protein
MPIEIWILDDVGAKCVKAHAFNKHPYSKLHSEAIGITNGVIFVTYSSLIASSEKGCSRLQQLAQWCGSEFDRLLAADKLVVHERTVADLIEKHSGLLLNQEMQKLRVNWVKLLKR